jgi:hypothetical protein
MSDRQSMSDTLGALPTGATADLVMRLLKPKKELT